MSWLIIDESADEEFFVIGALHVKNIDMLLDSLYRARNFVRNNKRITKKMTSKILNEMKENFLHNQGFGNIKTKLIQYIFENNESDRNLDNVKLYCCYYKIKQNEKIIESKKKELFIKSVHEILKEIRQNYDGIINVQAGESSAKKELQAIDMCVGCIRRSLHFEDLDNYSLMKKYTKIMEIK